MILLQSHKDFNMDMAYQLRPWFLFIPQAVDPLPWIEEQYALVVQDWMAVSTVEASTMYGYGAQT